MTGSERTSLSRLLEHAPRVASAAAISVGILVLLGWAFDLPLLKSALSGLAAMKANTALGFILAGVSLWSASPGAQTRPLRLVSRRCAAGVLLLGLLVIAEYLGGVDFGIDELLVRDVTNLPGDIPGRMAFGTAACFTSLGAALLLVGQEKSSLVPIIHALTIAPLLVAGAALVSYGYDLEAFLRMKLNYTPMALHTAAVFVVLGLGIVSARPHFPFRRIMTSDSPEGGTARRLLPAATVFPLLMGWLLLIGLETGYFSEAVGLALFAVTNVVGFSALIQWNAARLYQAEVQRRSAEKALQDSEKKYRELVDNLQEGIWVINAAVCITFVNPRMAEMLGYTADEMLGRPLFAFMDQGSVEAASRQIERIFQGIREQHEFDFLRKDGTRVSTNVETSPIYDEQGHYAGALAGVTDITARRRAEEELRHAHDQLELRVVERTLELAEANKALQNDIEA
ncbi:MAG: todS, partial [Proteobacteria bacterium]|nr:todS [Pseudomonadota bacterium]